MKYKEELLDIIEIAIGFNDLKKSDEYVANGIAEIKVGKNSNSPFQQVASIYSLPLKEVVSNIRDFTNKSYKIEIMGGFTDKNINFAAKFK